MPNKATLDRLRELGYEVGFAHGSVATEEEALDQARANASLEVLSAQTQQVTADTIRDLGNAGKLPEGEAARRQLAAEIADVALRQLSERAEGVVEFHQQAVWIAKDSPDVWVVSGPGVSNVYVACKADGTGWDKQQQEMLDALADQEAHDERVKQAKAGG